MSEECIISQMDTHRQSDFLSSWSELINNKIGQALYGNTETIERLTEPPELLLVLCRVLLYSRGLASRVEKRSSLLPAAECRTNWNCMTSSPVSLSQHKTVACYIDK